MIIGRRRGIGNAENGLIDGSDVVGQTAAGVAQQGANFVSTWANTPSPPVGIIPAGVLAYGLIKKSRTAIIVGGVWAGLQLLNWLGAQRLAPVPGPVSLLN